MAKLGSYEIARMKIKRIEKEIRDTPYHKGTEHHIGRLRAKLSKLKEDLEWRPSTSSGSSRGGYSVKKQGDATVVLIGPPSVGKSTLINKLTNAKSKIAPYSFTTLTVIPGMMDYRDAKIQILDVPGLIKGAEEGKGRGREVLSVVRGANLLVVMTDIDDLAAFDRINKTLEKNGIRVNKLPPDVKIEKKMKGGLQVISNIKQELDKETIREVAKEFGYGNAEVTIREKLTMDRLIDAFSRNRVYIPAIYVLNKIDLQHKSHKHNFYKGRSLAISAETDTGLDLLKNEIWKKLGFMRVYLVKPDEEPNNNNPLVVTKGILLREVLKLIGEEFSEGKTQAKIWGPGSKFPGQIVSLSKSAEDKMMIRYI
jgi:uncharacterized protein